MTLNSDFPKPIILIIEALNSKIRRQILIELEKKQSLSHLEILNIGTTLNSNINNHIKKLISAGLIKGFIKETEYLSLHYELTSLGRDSINGLFSAFKPKEDPS